MLHYPVDYAVIGVGALVVARAPLKPLVTGDLESEAVLGSELLQLGHHAVGDDGRAGRVETVHHGLDQGKLGADCVREEIGILSWCQHALQYSHDE